MSNKKFDGYKSVNESYKPSKTIVQNGYQPTTSQKPNTAINPTPPTGGSTPSKPTNQK